MALSHNMVEEAQKTEDNDRQLISELQSFEAQVKGRLVKSKHVSSPLRQLSDG